MSRQVLTYPDMPPVLTQDAGDLRYLQQGQADTLYAPLVHNHDAAYVNAGGDSMSGSLTVAADVMVRSGGGMYAANPGFTISAGWKYIDGQGLGYMVNGASVGVYFNTNGCLFLSGTLDTRPGAEGLAGSWFLNSAGARRAFVGGDNADVNTWRVYSNIAPQGDKLTVNLTNGYVSIPGGMGVSGVITTTGGVTGNGAVFNLASTANIQLSPAGSYIHPSADGTVNLGHPGINWAAVCTHAISAPGQLSITTGAHFVATTGGGGWIYLRSTGHTFFNGSVGAIVAPELDNRLICGGTGNRWQYVAAVNGGINTCFEHEKAIVGEIEPGDALDAILLTPFFLYHPKDCDGAVDEALTFAGPVNTSVDPRLQIGEGALTAAGHQAAYACSAIKALSARIEALEAARV